MSAWIPYPFYHDDVPVDISFVFEQEKPAGKHGFMKVEGRDLVFEDGTKVKFWGTNFNGWGCFPEHDYAEQLARRMAKLGINLVRFHQLDSQWHTPNIFSFTKGKRVTGAELDPESMDRLDYLIYCLKKEGVYCYMDMLTYRKFRAEEGVPNSKNLPDSAKPVSIFNDRMIELQKDLCTRLWQHENPYTKLRYCDDPAFVMAEITNECDLFSQHFFPMPEPYNTEFLTKFDRWLEYKGIDKKAADFDLLDFNNETLIDFKIDLQEYYFKTMYDHMRQCGIKIPITGTNWASTPANMKTHLDMDFMDGHCYHYDWRWGEYQKLCANDAITKEGKPSYMAAISWCSVKDKPTFVSEWDMPWPNAYRAESPIYSAAVGLLQGWSGFAIHTYSYSARLERMDMLGREIASEMIGNTPYRQGIFSTWNDPAKFGLFYHAALMTRRGDVAVAKDMITVSPSNKAVWDDKAVAAVMEKSAVVSEFSFTQNHEVSDIALPGKVVSDTGELMIDREKNYGWVDTDNTKCVYGMLCKNGKVELNGLEVTCNTDFGVIALSSLTDAPLSASDNILLTTVGRAENTDAKFCKDQLMDYGKAPVLVEVIDAEIAMKTERDDLVVWAISPEGFYIGTVPTTYENGVMKFHVGDKAQSMYYLIVKE